MAGEIERADMRASDADRTAVAQRLQRAVDEGRLTIIDYDERLQQAYAAKTYGELERVTADLPGPVVDKALVQADKKAATRRQEQIDAWRNWAGTSVVLITIWGIIAVSRQDFGTFWPAFPIGIWAAFLIASMISGPSKKS